MVVSVLRSLTGILLMAAIMVALAPFFSRSADLALKVGKAEIYCRMGNKTLCLDLATKITKVEPQSGLRMHQRNCHGNNSGASCKAASFILESFNDNDAALDSIIAACKLGEGGACLAAANLASDMASLKRPGLAMGVREYLGIASQNARIACDEDEAEACLLFGRLNEEDPKAQHSALRHGCYRLKDRANCGELAKFHVAQGEKQLAKEAALLLCDGQKNAGCDDLVPEELRRRALRSNASTESRHKEAI